MTGKELIIYILQNNLENEEIFKNGKLIGFITEEEAAVYFGVGTATIKTWVKKNMLPSVVIGYTTYIPAGAKVQGASYTVGKDGLKHYFEGILD